MSTTAHTPITSESLLALRFFGVSDSKMIYGNQKTTHLAAYFSKGKWEVYLVDYKDVAAIPFRHLKSIEQLKTIIEVCL